MAQGKFLFTSEAVSMGHPDKLADQISDGILDALFAKDPMQPRGLRDDGHHRHRHRRRRNHHQGRDRLSRGRPPGDPGGGLRGRQDGHLRRHLRRDALHRPAKPGHRHGRERGRRQGEGDRRRRPGADVRLRLQRHARTDAAADSTGPPDAHPADRGPQARRGRLAAAGQQEPGHRGIRRAEAGADRHGRPLHPTYARGEPGRDPPVRRSRRSSSRCCRSTWSTGRSRIT